MDSSKESDDRVYFLANASAISFVGYVDELSSLQEPDIAEWIFCSNPKLYEKIGGVPRASSWLQCDDPDSVSAESSPSQSSLSVEHPRAEAQRVTEETTEQGEVKESFVLGMHLSQLQELHLR